eukprot:761032-Hanusia_phi.AAC.8
MVRAQAILPSTSDRRVPGGQKNSSGSRLGKEREDEELSEDACSAASSAIIASRMSSSWSRSGLPVSRRMERAQGSQNLPLCSLRS